jgi:hypothetical protein
LCGEYYRKILTKPQEVIITEKKCFGGLGKCYGLKDVS